MTEIEKLIEQRKEIDKKIKALKNHETQFGMVRMSKKEQCGGYFNVQTLVNTLTDHGGGKMWMVTIRERTKEEVMHNIRVLISDMSDLLKSLEENDEKHIIGSE